MNATKVFVFLLFYCLFISEGFVKARSFLADIDDDVDNFDSNISSG